jgi:hypothetical protein
MIWAAREPLQKARAIFARQGAIPLIEETDSNLQAPGGVLVGLSSHHEPDRWLFSLTRCLSEEVGDQWSVLCCASAQVNLDGRREASSTFGGAGDRPRDDMRAGGTEWLGAPTASVAQGAPSSCGASPASSPPG